MPAKDRQVVLTSTKGEEAICFLALGSEAAECATDHASMVPAASAEPSCNLGHWRSQWHPA